VPEAVVPLSGTEWRLVELEAAPVAGASDARAPHLVFDLEESRVAGSGGVNRLMGTFALAEGELSFGPLATTLMAGPEEAMQLEQAFLDALARVTSYSLDGSTLSLLADDQLVARLAC
jgi:copper homeostasis protein (lipoprotein)